MSTYFVGNEMIGNFTIIYNLFILSQINFIQNSDYPHYNTGF